MRAERHTDIRTHSSQIAILRTPTGGEIIITMTIMMQFLPRDVTLALPSGVCLADRLSQAGSKTKLLNGSSSFSAQRLPSSSSTSSNKGANSMIEQYRTSAYATRCYNRLRISPKIRVLPSGTVSQTLNLTDFFLFFATARRLIVVSGQFSSTIARLSR